jgi:hypothetical protein
MPSNNGRSLINPALYKIAATKVRTGSSTSPPA